MIGLMNQWEIICSMCFMSTGLILKKDCKNWSFSLIFSLASLKILITNHNYSCLCIYFEEICDIAFYIMNKRQNIIQHNFEIEQFLCKKPSILIDSDQLTHKSFEYLRFCLNVLPKICFNINVINSLNVKIMNM